MRFLALNGDRTVVVAVIAMRVVQVTLYEVVDVIAVGNRFVATVGTMLMLGVVPRTVVRRSADVWVGGGNFEHMLFHLTVRIYMVQVSVVQVIDVVTVPDTGVFAIGAVLMVVMGMQIRHDSGSFGGVVNRIWK